MRNQNKDIIIHSLVEKKQNKTESKTPKYDYCEEMSISEKRLESLRVLREIQAKKEKSGKWISVIHETGKYQMFVPKGHNIEKSKQNFIKKLEQRAKNSV